MKELLQVEVTEAPLALISGITFSQVPYWFPHYPTKDLKLNLICPFGPPEERRPLLVWVCGGGFITMDRAAHTPWLLGFARQGYIVASAEYRRSNSAHFPGALEDVKAAIRYLRANAENYGIDPARVAVMGESAGAYLAAMTGLTNGKSEYDVGAHLEQSSAVSAVVDLYGPSSFLPIPGVTRDESRIPAVFQGPSVTDAFLGAYAAEEPELARRASPMDNVTDNAPPFFIAHGTDDPIVPIAHSDRLYEQLTAHNIPTEYYPVAGASHAGPQFYQDALRERILRFLERTL